MKSFLRSLYLYFSKIFSVFSLKKNDKKKSIDNMKYYFAYGSNMDKEDLNSWCKEKRKPKIEFLSVSPVKLNGYKLSFNYFSSLRKSGAANIMKSDEDCIYGLLVGLEEESIKIIREKEGYPNYYDEINVEVEKFDGTIVRGVKTYKALKEKERSTYIAPKKYYLSLIIKNAKKYSFQNEYIEFLKSFETKD